jgi:hypothetical protein
MATGSYGTIRPADVSIDDIEVLMHFTPSRTTGGNGVNFTSIDPATVLNRVANPNGNGTELMGGIYTLTLPSTMFNQKGFYTLLIKPVEIRTRIVDCGVLSALPNVKGLVFDINAIDNRFIGQFQNNGLVGYRIEYLENGNKVNNMFRIITSNNKAEPVNQNLTNTNQKAIRYRFNDNSSLVFATVTPSSTSNVKPNVLPFIGEPNQEIIITNTFFNPVMIEIEMVEHDIETIAYGLFGNQTKSLEDGIYTIYNFNNQIYKQYNLFEIKDRFSGKPLFEVRELRTNIDFLKGFDNITNV